jgi:hypothetical protein
MSSITVQIFLTHFNNILYIFFIPKIPKYIVVIAFIGVKILFFQKFANQLIHINLKNTVQEVGLLL